MDRHYDAEGHKMAIDRYDADGLGRCLAGQQCDLENELAFIVLALEELERRDCATERRPGFPRLLFTVEQANAKFQSWSSGRIDTDCRPGVGEGA